MVTLATPSADFRKRCRKRFLRLYYMLDFLHFQPSFIIFIDIYLLTEKVLCALLAFCVKFPETFPWFMRQTGRRCL